MKYKVCKNCGANLDLGESCSCEQMRSEDLRAISEVQNILRQLRLDKEVPIAALVETVKESYPSYDKSLHSKCEHGDRYGIELRKDAFDSLILKFAPELMPKIRHKRNGCHNRTCRVSCRLTDDDYFDLIEKIKSDGFDTMQDFLEWQIKKYLKG